MTEIDRIRSKNKRMRQVERTKNLITMGGVVVGIILLILIFTVLHVSHTKTNKEKDNLKSSVTTHIYEESRIQENPFKETVSGIFIF